MLAWMSHTAHSVGALHCFIASAGHCTKPGHIHLWIMCFVRGVVAFPGVGCGENCHWGICLGLHLFVATDETPTLSISQLPVTSLLRSEWWWYWDDLTWGVSVLSHLQYIRGTVCLLTCSQCIWQADGKAKIVEHFLFACEVTESTFHFQIKCISLCLCLSRSLTICVCLS